MRYALSSIAALRDAGFDRIFDVRSPAEFAEDHLPGAENLPVLDDAERAQVGTIYVQESRFEARRLGAALVARNAARHLETALADAGPGLRPLVYCWRGGQRSGAFARVLSQIGWRVSVLEGGWRSWRRLVVRRLYETPFPAPLLVLDGNTGTAKTALLDRVAQRGMQTVDLEALARHRGSVFGNLPGGQPAQKAFESALAVALAGIDPDRPVLVEAESNRIGALNLPPVLWQAMQAAPRLTVAAPLAARAAYLAGTYGALLAEPGRLASIIDRLRPYHAAARIAEWHQLAESGDHALLAGELMQHHYDPRYARSRSRPGFGGETVLPVESLDGAALDALADRIVAQVQRLAPPAADALGARGKTTRGARGRAAAVTPDSEKERSG